MLQYLRSEVERFHQMHVDVTQKRKKTWVFKRIRIGLDKASLANPFDHPTQLCAHKYAHT